MSRQNRLGAGELITLTPKQSNIFQWGWRAKARFRDAVCGRRFGKTFLGAAEMRRAAANAVKWGVLPDDEIWYGAPTFKQAKRVFWKRLKRAIPKAWIDGKPNETECSITLKTGHVLRIVGLDAYDNLRGSGLFFILIDEWADCPFEAWTEVIRPMLSTCKYAIDGVKHHGGHVLRIGTPKGFNHCYDSYNEGQLGGLPNHKSWLYTTLDGGNVPEDEVEEAKRTLDLRTFRQEYEACFENYSGRVYYAFDRRHNVKPCAWDPKLPVHIGMDFNVNPMSATVFQEHENGEIWQVGEISILTSDTVEMCKVITETYKRDGFDPAKPDLKHITIYPDPAGNQQKTSARGDTDISLIKKAGLRVIAMEAHPLTRDRFNLLNAKFCAADGKTRKFYVDPKCKKSIECYEKQTYKEGTNDQDKDSGFDHLPDATGYYIYTKFAYIPARRMDVPHIGR